jgi:hypothetical protein
MRSGSLLVYTVNELKKGEKSKMKKMIYVLILAVLLMSFAVLPVSAKSPVVKGEVTAINGDAITVLTGSGQSVIIIPPAGFDLSSIVIGDAVIAKGKFQADGSLVADWVKKVVSEPADEDTAEGGKAANAAFCADGKKQAPHPMAVVLAEKYGVTTDWVMENYCKGYSIGAIMLALKTHQISGASADDLLARRSGGEGWGAIWQEQHMIGNEKDANPHPGLLKKQTKPGK